jgi:hypothetical protein
VTVPSSTGIGAPGTAPAPASLSRSPMSASPSGAATAIPFTRGSTLATMQDATLTVVPSTTYQIQLQTNAFLENIVLDVAATTSGNACTFSMDSPWTFFSSIQLLDPAGQAIITPITGYQLYLLNKYLPDTDCAFDPIRDPNYLLATATGILSFRLSVPVEHRRRDALGALNNSAANQRYLLTLTTSALNTIGQGNLFLTNALTTAAVYTVNAYQQYWTSPPATITTSAGATQVQGTPSGLGTVGFVRYERHNEMNGGGAPQIQLNNVGDYISDIFFVNRLAATYNLRDQASWPNPWAWWVNDFQVFALTVNDWQRWMARFYNFWSGIQVGILPPTLGGMLDIGVFTLPWLHGLFDNQENFGPANQYLPTDATTKLQIRGSTWGSTVGFVEVITRLIRPVSGAALFA